MMIVPWCLIFLEWKLIDIITVLHTQRFSYMMLKRFCHSQKKMRVESWFSRARLWEWYQEKLNEKMFFVQMWWCKYWQINFFLAVALDWYIYILFFHWNTLLFPFLSLILCTYSFLLENQNENFKIKKNIEYYFSSKNFLFISQFCRLILVIGLNWLWRKNLFLFLLNNSEKNCSIWQSMRILSVRGEKNKEKIYLIINGKKNYGFLFASMSFYNNQ
jgi:hypothetical protein